MHATATTAAHARPASASAELPAQLKLLFITTAGRTGGWLAEAFAADGASHVVLDEVIGVTAGFARLRDEAFDAVLVSHDPDVLDATEFVAALRGSGHEEPLIVLGDGKAHELDALCYEAGADDYCCVAETTVRGLLWKFARAIERCNLGRENRRLLQAERQRLQQEQKEAERLIEQQRAIIADLEELAEPTGPRLSLAPTDRDSLSGNSEPPQLWRTLRALPPLPAALVDHYRELLRAYVIMGAGNLTREMAILAALLAESNVSAQQTMQLHVQVLEELVEGLGNRSARHVMNRADLLALEVMGHLADGYRQRYHDRLRPPRQKLLPGFAA